MTQLEPRIPNTDILTHTARLLVTMTTPNRDVTDLLKAWSQGDCNALERLMEVIQSELHKIAKRFLRTERSSHTLQPTALINELYLKLTDQRQIEWRGRAQFFAAAATLMRRILVDYARRHEATKRGGQTIRVTLDEADDIPADLVPDILALDHALIDLARRSPRQSRIVEMRVLVGLTLEEIAAVEKVAPTTVSRDWKAARLFLLSQLRAT